MLLTLAVCPVKVFMFSPVATSHKWRVLEYELASVLPSGLNTMSVLLREPG